MLRFITHYTIFALMIVALSSCGTSHQENQKLIVQAGDIFTNRPQRTEQSIVILKLKHPPLLQDARLDNDRKPHYDIQAKRELLKQQAAVEIKLKELSKDIQILHRYRFVLNGFVLVVPTKDLLAISNFPEVSSINQNSFFAPTQTKTLSDQTTTTNLKKTNNRDFLGLGQTTLQGEGVTIGIIDSGIDYTHQMLGGLGDREFYQKIDPSGEPLGFPNNRIIGGIDLVGSRYHPNSLDFEQRIPKPDSNPLDEDGHGTHIAGILTGPMGIAPQAKLHAIKVFGGSGTSDFVVIAGLEYAADPNSDMDHKDRLDIVNISLGNKYGPPQELYNQAVSNLIRGGTVVVAGAGNEGNIPHIVSSPSTVADAISVAASVDNQIHHNQIADKLTDFSSRGPRSMDSLIKPEVTAPGFKIISAAMGRGDKTIAMNGTSMAAPYVTGAIALLSQKFPSLSPKELKALVLNSAKPLFSNEDSFYPISRQGAGRLQIGKALNSKLILSPETLSLGENFIQSSKKFEKTILIKNISGNSITVQPKFKGSTQIKLYTDQEINVPAHSSRSIKIEFIVDPIISETQEVDGFLSLIHNDKSIAQIPVLGVLTPTSKILSSLNEGALNLKNQSSHYGEALILAPLGTDPPKNLFPLDEASRSSHCDLESAGFRIRSKEISGEKYEFLQLALKLYRPINLWKTCHLSLLIDSDEDGIADQELAAIAREELQGLDGIEYQSFLLNATKMRQIRTNYEESVHLSPLFRLPENYRPAIITTGEARLYSHSTIATFEAELSQLALTADKKLKFRLATSHNDPLAIEADDFLGSGIPEWKTIDLDHHRSHFPKLPYEISLAPGESLSLPLQSSHESLLLYFPHNSPEIKPSQSVALGSN